MLRAFARNRSAVLGLAIVLVFLFVAVAAPLLTPYDPYEMNMPLRLQPPSATHVLGTDDFGRDLLTRIIFGARISLTVSLSTVALSLLIGVSIGLVSGYLGGASDIWLMRLVDVFLSFPPLLLALSLVAVLGTGIQNLIIALALVLWTTYARVVRASTLAIKEEEYVEAARVVGARTWRILVRHILPNAAGPIIVIAALGMGNVIVSEAALSFLGLGVKPPEPSWGTTLTFGLTYLREDPYLSTFPGLAIMLAVLGFNLLGDGLRDLLDAGKNSQI
ncbi:MAG: ABC transporter permease [Chloroflexi bacterium]|nr:ABC transporter permease [Chloroflexota bacterium]